MPMPLSTFFLYETTMTDRNIQITYRSCEGRDALPAGDAALLSAADGALEDAYAPYSRFRVGAAVRLSDGSLLTGSNQENASFPAGICAERVLLSAVSALHPRLSVTSMAITYRGEGIPSSHPLAPCGICRQTLVEYEERFGSPIRMVLAGQSGEVLVFAAAADLLPFRFSGAELPSSTV
jgi:cytidine deaminase